MKALPSIVVGTAVVAWSRRASPEADATAKGFSMTNQAPVLVPLVAFFAWCLVLIAEHEDR